MLETSWTAADELLHATGVSAMNEAEIKRERRTRRRLRVRRKLFGTADRPRLSVSRSLKNIGAQLIDDVNGNTLCAASTQSKELAGRVKHGGNREAATLVGQLLGERARMHGIRKAAYDRNGYKYHGRVKALAEAARKAGLEF